MTTETRTKAEPRAKALISKVPEVTLWFWVIKVLCTTVGESFADWVNNSLGKGLGWTAAIFTVVLAVVLLWQLRLRRYVPFAYWLTVVALSVTGTLYTDILTDDHHVPLALSTTVFAAILAVVFAVWYRRERTLSIHSINTLPRELFYWLAILITFALGTAAGDWTLELTGWSPGISVLLPVALIVAVLVGWRLGANAVLAFWLAYILTRPLGANLGDWFASNKTDGGLGIGTAGTSVIFLLAILATVVYLTVTRADAPERQKQTTARPVDKGRERILLGYFAVVIGVTAAVLTAAHGHNRSTTSAADETGPSAAGPQLNSQAATQHFPLAEVTTLRAITADMLRRVEAGDQAGSLSRAKDLETAWDKDQPVLQPKDSTAWHFLDGEIDKVLTSVRAKKPDPTTETSALQTLLGSLSG